MTIAYDIDQLIKDYEWTSSGHFFSESTMKFFKSRTTNLYKRINDNNAYFVTTEKKCFNDDTRVFTLRKATLFINDDNRPKIKIETVQTFDKRNQAVNAIKYIE